MLQKKRKKDNISGKEKFGFGTWATKCIIFFFLIKKWVSGVNLSTSHHMAEIDNNMCTNCRHIVIPINNEKKFIN